MRLIDVDATIEYLRESKCKDCERRKGVKNGKIRFCYEIGDAPCRACDIEDTIDFILDEAISPTVDAVPVVRCKDCRFHFIDGDNVRYNMCALDRIKAQPDNWFCAGGERREHVKPVTGSATDWDGVNCE